MATDLGIWNFEAALAVLVTRRPDTIPIREPLAAEPRRCPLVGVHFRMERRVLGSGRLNRREG